MDLEEFAKEFREIGERRIAALRAQMTPHISGRAMPSHAMTENHRLWGKVQGIEMMMDTFDQLYEVLDA